MFRFYLVAFLATVLTALAQILLKLGAVKGSRSNDILRSYLNLNTILGYGLMLFVTLMNLYAYRVIDLKFAAILLPLTLVFVALLSFTVLKERFPKNKLVGAVVIVVGITVFNL